MKRMHSVNLCKTVENHPRYETQRCTVGLAINPAANGGRRWAFNHTWSDHIGGLGGGTCANCGKKLKEVRVRINPKTGEPVRKASRMAREIALTAADVPPIRFHGFPS